MARVSATGVVSAAGAVEILVVIPVLESGMGAETDAAALPVLLYQVYQVLQVRVLSANAKKSMK